MLSRIKTLLLHNRNTRQTVAKNIFWLTVGQIGTRLLRSLVIIYAARVLGTGEYGVFSYVLGLAGFFSIFVDVGLNPILTKEAAKNPDEAINYFATIFWIKATFLALTALAIIFLAPHFSKIEEAKVLLPLAAILVAFDGLREFASAFFRAKEKMELEALITTVTNVAITIFGFIILRKIPTAGALVTTYALSAGTGTLLAVFLLRHELRSILSRFKKELLKPILILAWPIALVSLTSVLMLNVDIIMLGFFKTAQDVGLYSAGQKIVQLLYVFPAILAASLYPVFARFVGQKNNERVKELMENGVAMSLLLAIPLATGGIILAQSIIRFLYGASYGAAAPIFQALLFTVFTNFLSAHFANYIMVYDQQKRSPMIVLAGSLANVVFCGILIPLYGALGAAIATVLAQALFQGLLWRLTKQINNYDTLRHLKKITFSAVVMGAIAFTLNTLGLHVIVNIGISAIVYFVILYMLKEKTLLEIKYLFSRI